VEYITNEYDFSLMTIHASKGLEAKCVILVGVEEGLLPLKIFPDTSEEEEKRLTYVAITRAKDKFFFSSVRERKVFNFTLKKGLSRFFRGAPVKEYKKPPKKPKQVGLF
jgi:DNA helicase-2/ATP-dependent DNA helicase PcrA